jgi:aquaporin Z
MKPQVKWKEVQTGAARSGAGPWESVSRHWPEYLCEAAGLGLFMISACVFAVLLEHPSSFLNNAVESDFLRRAIGGAAMGSTALAIIYSPLGRRSGAHLNPAMTVNYWLLGKVRGWDALFYVLAQFSGGIAGEAIAELLIGMPLRHSSVNYAVTAPSRHGVWIALAAEFVIALILMLTVLSASNSRRLTRLTPVFAATLVALFIVFESPLSGMSMNPARTLGSDLAAGEWNGLWVYFTAPPLAMYAAAAIYTKHFGIRSVLCAKLHHHNSQRCIFRCDYEQLYRGNKR